MSESRTKRSLINISAGLINQLVATLLPFVIRTIVIYTIGIEYLGVDSLFASILSILSLSELGFSAAVVYALYKPVADGDDEKVKALLTFYKKMYRLVGIIIIGVGLTLIPFLNWFIPEGASYPEGINIQLVYLVFLINTGASYLLFAYKEAILVATMRNDVSSFIDMVRSVVSHGLQIVVLLLFRQYYLYILVLPIVTITNSIVRSIIIDKRYPQYKGNAVLSKEDRHDIMTRVGALIGNKIGGAVFTTVDSLVISKFLGLVVLAQYTNYFTIFTAVFGIESTVYNAFQSVVGNSLVSNSKDMNYELFKDLFLINAVLTSVCTCCFTSLYQPFIKLWVGADNVLGVEIPLLLALYFFVKSTRRIGYLFKEAAGMWREDFLKPYVSVALNLCVNIVLVQVIGLPGVIISSIAAIVLVEFPWETSVLFKKYFHMSMFPYFKDIGKLVIITSLCFTVTYSISCYLPEGIIGIILRLLFTVTICVVAYIPVLKFASNGKRVTSRFTQLLKKNQI